MRRRSALFVCSLLCAAAAQAQERLAQFDAESAAVPPPWRVVHLDSKVAATRYRVARTDGVLGITAEAKSSMALLARPVEVDLHRTPVLCWRWRVDAPLVKADMASRAGDDYAARVYVSFALPPDEMGFVLRSKLKLARAIWGDAVPDAALSYVWDNRYPVGTRKPNAYTDRTRMIVAESGVANAGRWVAARHDVLQDFNAEFGALDSRLIQLAIASDTDNTGETARAGFADFHFVGKDAGCFAGQT